MTDKDLIEIPFIIGKDLFEPLAKFNILNQARKHRLVISEKAKAATPEVRDEILKLLIQVDKAFEEGLVTVASDIDSVVFSNTGLGLYERMQKLMREPQAGVFLFDSLSPLAEVDETAEIVGTGGNRMSAKLLELLDSAPTNFERIQREHFDARRRYRIWPLADKAKEDCGEVSETNHTTDYKSPKGAKRIPKQERPQVKPSAALMSLIGRSK